MSPNAVNIVLEESVREAIENKKPIVALESTIIAHGMPYPQNLETAKILEEVVRSAGATPATCAVIKGVCKVGLSADELEILATKECLKLSRRDLPLAVAQRRHGATTVAATMILAQKAGVRVFATGGIGGVHRDYSSTLDISADLIELAQTDVAVVSAGCKSILDIQNTLEILETLSVPVIGYKSDDFPAFYSGKSGFKTPVLMNSSTEIARFLQVKWEMGLKGGALITHPIPEESALDFDEMEILIEKALAKASSNGIKGKDLTPFLLKSLVESTDGESLKTNIILAKNNALLASEIAVELSGLS